MEINEIHEDSLLKLDNQLCFALYVCSKEIIRKYKPLLDPLNLTYTSYITLLVLWETDGIPVKDLGSRLYLDSGTLTPVLKKMEKDRLVERIRSSEDERSVSIFLTEKGKQLKDMMRHIPKDLFCSSGICAQDAGMLLSALHKVMETLQH